MSDFASLLGQLQQSAQSLANSNSNSNSNSTRTTTNDSTNNNADSSTNDEQPARKRVRQINAKDFPPVKTIFILCPAGVQTGGPEALHQLCDALNETTNVPAYMLYLNSSGHGSISWAARAKTPPPYRHYSANAVSYDPFLMEEGNNQSHLLIWPECWTDEMIGYLNDTTTTTSMHNHIPCAIWWLSVDNNTRRFKAWDRKDIIHLHQSEYAKQHLLKHGVMAEHVVEMTEYISNPPPPSSSSSNTEQQQQDRSIDVIFNPLKGVHYTDEIRKRSTSRINFQPIGGGPQGRIRISPNEVRQLLHKAKIYMDFGPHPGMDRLPREAALAGCLVVTNMEGAAFYEQDVPLPAKYKVRKFDPAAINKLLKDLLDNAEERNKDLDEYRSWIRGQKERMKECVHTLVEELVTKRAGNVEKS